MINIAEFVKSMGWDELYKDIVLKCVHGKEIFNELQIEFIKWGGLEKDRILVSAPTASGKTLLGILGILKRFYEGKNTFIYLVPYNSIRDEKYNEFLEQFKELNLIIKNGYKGLRDLQNGKANIVISDFSSFDKYAREHPDFELASFYVLDEIDVLGSDFFGPSIEGSIARLLRKGIPNLLAISATIPEKNKLIEWLDAEFFKSDYKPIRHNEEVKIIKDNYEEICNIFLSDNRTKNKSILVMIYDKKRVMSYAEKIVEILHNRGTRPLNDDDPMILDIIGSNPKTITNKNLINCLKYKVAFHHSDLHNSIKNKILEYYNNDEIKIIMCTPTLLRGVNLKTRTVILPDPYIFNIILNRRIQMPYIDYLQFKGRAGRPPYEDVAYVYIFSQNETTKSQFEKFYLHGKEEPLKSGFIDYRNRIIYPLLDKQILIELFYEPRNIEELTEVFSKYYFAVGVPDFNSIINKLNDRISLLENKKLIEKNIYAQFTLTLLGDEYLRNFEGKNISIEHYDSLNNLSLRIMTDQITFDDRFHFRILNEILNILGSENFIKIRKRGAERDEIEEEIRRILRLKCGILTDTINSQHITLVCLIEHLSHIPLERIDEQFGVDSTRLESVLKNTIETYLDSVINIIKFLYKNFNEIFIEEKYQLGEDFNNISCEKLVEMLNYLKDRVHYGVKFELIPIIWLKNIGNFRGISLYNALNNRFANLNQMDWTVIEKIKGEIIKTEITGWGETLKEQLLVKLDEVLKVEKRVKNILSLFNIDYNLKNQ